MNKILYNEETIEEAKTELRENARQELKQVLTLSVPDISEYDNVVIAGPCWWETYPMAIFTQVEKFDFTGKKVFALMTHEGSGQASSERDVKKYCKGATVGKGLAVHGGSVGSSKNVVEKWAKENLI